MKKLLRRPSLSVLAAAVALVAAAPAGALAAETVSEAPGAPTEPVTPAPEATPTPAPGWIPQGAGTDSSGDGAAPIRRGSSLGSASPGGASGEEPSRSDSSAGYYEPESSTPTTPSSVEEATSASEEASGVSAVQAPAKERPAAAAKGDAAAVAAPPSRLDVPRGNDGALASAPAAEAATDSLDQAGSSSGALPMLAAIVLGLVLIYAGAHLGLRLWRRRDEKRQLAGLRDVEVEWEATLNRIAPAAAKPSKKQPRRVKLGSDSVPLPLPTNGATGQDQASRKPARAG